MRAHYGGWSYFNLGGGGFNKKELIDNIRRIILSIHIPKTVKINILCYAYK